jgi:hypothetical protein
MNALLFREEMQENIELDKYIDFHQKIFKFI